MSAPAWASLQHWPFFLFVCLFCFVLFCFVLEVATPVRTLFFSRQTVPSVSSSPNFCRFVTFSSSLFLSCSLALLSRSSVNLFLSSSFFFFFLLCECNCLSLHPGELPCKKKQEARSKKQEEEEEEEEEYDDV